MFQYPEHQLFENDVISDVCFGPMNQGLSREEAEKEAKQALTHVGVKESNFKKSPFELSGGQKKRVAIAGVLAMNPKILILDDSTSAVDTATDAKIRAAFATEIPNTTKIIIAQRISSVEHADRIIVMNEGEINGIGTHEELLAGNDIYREVYESQNGAGANADFDEEASSNKEVNQHA